MAGPRDNLAKGWSLLRKGLDIEPSALIGVYLGCSHEVGTMQIGDITTTWKTSLLPVLIVTSSLPETALSFERWLLRSGWRIREPRFTGLPVRQVRIVNVHRANTPCLQTFTNRRKTEGRLKLMLARLPTKSLATGCNQSSPKREHTTGGSRRGGARRGGGASNPIY